VSACIYAERARIVQARRMEADSTRDGLYAPIIDALDLLLEHILPEVDDDEWTRGLRNAGVQLVTAILSDGDRCDLFRSVHWALSDAGLNLTDF
jgi:hypothetical protein